MSFTCHLFAQSKKNGLDTIINLQEVMVDQNKRYSIMVSPGKKDDLHVQGKGKLTIISKVTVDKHKKYFIDALEFYFNYKWQGLEGEGFVVKPVIIRMENGKEIKNYLPQPAVCFVSNKVNEKMYIDLSEYNVVVDNTDSFFVGLEFVDAKGRTKFEDFNITMTMIKKEANASYVRKDDQSEYSQLFWYPKDRFGLTLKYRLFYKIVE